MKTKLHIVFYLFLISILLNCKSYIATGDYLAIQKDASIKTLSDNKLQGESCQWMVLFFPIGTVSLNNAYNEALKKAPEGTTGLASASVEAKVPLFGGFILSKTCLLLEGYPAKR